MLINRETDYALRILRVLGDGERHQMGALCEAEEVPQPFAYRIMKKLAAADMVESIRGVDGGYRLICDLRALTLYDFIELMDCEHRVGACMEDGYVCRWQCGHTERCQINRRLRDIQAVVDRELKAHTLHSVLFGAETPSANRE